MTKTEFDRKRRHARRASGLCTHCGKEDAYTMAGRSLCADCVEKRRTYVNQHRHSDQSVCDRKNERAKMLRKERKAAGLCTSCGHPVFEHYATCDRCRARMRKYNANYRRRDNPEVNFPRGENGICYQCNKNKAIPGKRLCQYCYEKAIAQMEQINAKGIRSEAFAMENDLTWKTLQSRKSV